MKKKQKRNKRRKIVSGDVFVTREGADFSKVGRPKPLGPSSKGEPSAPLFPKRVGEVFRTIGLGLSFILFFCILISTVVFPVYLAHEYGSWYLLGLTPAALGFLWIVGMSLETDYY